MFVSDSGDIFSHTRALVVEDSMNGELVGTW